MKNKISYRLKTNKKDILTGKTEYNFIDNKYIFYENKIKVIINIENNSITRETNEYLIFIKKEEMFVNYFDKILNKHVIINTNKIKFETLCNKLEVEYIIKDSNDCYNYKVKWE